MSKSPSTQTPSKVGESMAPNDVATPCKVDSGIKRKAAKKVKDLERIFAKKQRRLEFEFKVMKDAVLGEPEMELGFLIRHSTSPVTTSVQEVGEESKENLNPMLPKVEKSEVTNFVANMHAYGGALH